MFHADATPFPRLAFAISRAVGNAVVRNRARRQVRAIMADIRREQPELVAAGDYLVGIRRAPFEYAEARRCLTRALEQLAAR